MTKAGFRKKLLKRLIRFDSMLIMIFDAFTRITLMSCMKSVLKIRFSASIIEIKDRLQRRAANDGDGQRERGRT